MHVDSTTSLYQEAESAKTDFDPDELRHCRMLLRRLRFLESQVDKRGGLAADANSGGAAFTEWEMSALAWVLDDIGFLAERRKTRQNKRERVGA